MTKTDHKFPFLAHARASGLTIPAVTRAGDAAAGRVLRQGEEFLVTEELHAATVDRVGESWIDLDEQAQVARYGMVRWAKGPKPDGMTVGGDDEGHLYRMAQAAKAYADAISDPKERAAALKVVNDEYGAVLHPIAQHGQIIPGR